ncbi:unnamed protein product [Polarella glacialis]|uniref:Polynucleotide adenylyltransferase n=1 Tax=Polarella glacialis TaxID=89957 RepID=A0A813KHL2_POLGL|nr:unnamed protein product [Polarella glacialis]
MRRGFGAGYFGAAPSSSGSRAPRIPRRPVCDADALRQLASAASGLELRFRPSSATVARRQRVLQQLKEALADLPGVQEVVLGGSTAKGTDLDGDDSDIDVVVIFDGLERLVSEQRYEESLADIREILRAELSVELERRSFYTVGQRLRLPEAGSNIENRGTYLHGSHNGVSFDVLLGVDLEDDLSALREAQPGPPRARFSGSFVRLHTAFVAGAQVNKDGVRLAKWWVRHVLQLGAAVQRPRGFLIELVAVYASRSRRLNSAQETLIAILEHFVSWQLLQITWSWAEADWQQFHPPARLPIILDPCNPTNNVARTLRRRSWRLWASLAQELLQLVRSSGEQSDDDTRSVNSLGLDHFTDSCSSGEYRSGHSGQDSEGSVAFGDFDY